MTNSRSVGRRSILAAAGTAMAGLAIDGAGRPARAAAYPTRPVRVIVPHGDPTLLPGSWRSGQQRTRSADAAREAQARSVLDLRPGC